MPFHPETHHRRSIRLKDYDYTQSGLYFVTICVQDKVCVFGEIIDGVMSLNPYGQIVEEEWQRTAMLRNNVELDEYIIMPNHFHGIIQIVNEPRRDMACHVPPATKTNNKIPIREFGKPIPGSLSTIIGSFKSAVTKRINELSTKPVGTRRVVSPHATSQNIASPTHPSKQTLNTFPAIEKRLWQKNYYEHIIRNEYELFRIREYIINNPLNWNDDELYL